MELITVDDYNELSRYGAKLAKQLIEEKPGAVMMPAMGNTPMGMYLEISTMSRNGELDTSQLRILQLDGYLGLEPNDSRSLTGWLQRSVIEPWNIHKDHVVTLPEDGVSIDTACRNYEHKVREEGGIDLAILGLGPNGHLGFNEPPSGPNSPTRSVALTEESIRSNAVYWGGEDKVPRYAITAGMDILLSARHIILLVNGEHKHQILQKTIEGPVSDIVPSSYLQLHPNVTVITDKSTSW